MSDTNTAHRLDYPPELERAWLDISATTLRSSSDTDTLDRLTPLAAELSDTFTTKRQPGFRDYSASPDHWLAYSTYFFPQTFVRMRYVLEECLRKGAWSPTPGNGPIRVLDLGAGTGAATAAVATTLQAHFPNRVLDIHATDASETAMSLLRQLHANPQSGLQHARITTQVAPIREFDIGTSDQPQPAEGSSQWDLITVSFALNEMLESASPDAAEHWTREALAKLAPGGLLILLEPALHTACERIEHLRDQIAAQRLARIVAPCPHHMPCPMLAAPDAWCHDVRRWYVPESVAYINRKLQRSVQFLKFCFLALTNAPPPAPVPDGTSYCRIVAPMNEPRGRICTLGCAADGHIHPYEVQTRDLTSDERRVFRTLDRGNTITWQQARVLGDNRTIRGVPTFEESGNEQHALDTPAT